MTDVSLRYSPRGRRRRRSGLGFPVVVAAGRVRRCRVNVRRGHPRLL